MLHRLKKLTSFFNPNQPPRPEDYVTSFTLALALAASVKKIFKQKSGQKLSSEPRIERKGIVPFGNRMRVNAMEKFNKPTVFAVIYFYKDRKSLEKKSLNDLVGTLIVYIEQKFIPELLRILKYPYIDADDEEEILDGSGTLANLVAGGLKRELSELCSGDYEMTSFESHINSFVDGFEFPIGLTESYEISYELDGDKILVTDMVFKPLIRKTA